MAARLPLILAQPSRRDAIATDLVENVVAAALLLPKLDANLIGDLNTLQSGSTDHLCLQGHGRDVILASFLELDDAKAAWSRLGLVGSFVDCHRPAAEIRASSVASTDRRVFYFQLTAAMRVSHLLDKCQELVASQAVQLVSLQLGGKSTAGVSLPLLPKPAIPRLPTQSVPTTISPTQQAQAHQLHAHQAHTPALPLASNALTTAADDEEWSQLDKLVDELDAFDI